MKLVFHVGAHKTGTSAIQAFLFKNREMLRESGLYYQTPDGHNNHSLLARMIGRGDKDSVKIIHELSEAAVSNECGICLFSSECFSENPFDDSLFKEAVEGFEVEVFSYIRSPIDLMESAYYQLVRTEYTRWTTRIAERKPYDPSFHSIFKRWMNSSVWSFTIAPYDNAQWTRNNLLADFLSMIDVNPSGYDLSTSIMESNRRLPTSLIEVLRAANTLNLTNEQHERFVSSLFDCFDERPELYPNTNLYSDAEIDQLFNDLRSAIPLYEPYFREGMDTDFLFRR